MRFENVCIEGLSYLLPESVISSSEIEKHLTPLYQHLKIPAGTLEALTGVKERRLWPVELSPSHFASKAGSKTLEIARRRPEDIDLLIYAGVCRDFIEPATAHLVHHQLKLSAHCMSFDLSNACVGFFNAMLISAQMIEMGKIRNALIVAGENAAPLLERTINVLLTDKSEGTFHSSLASLTLGSGAVGMLLTHRDISSQKHSLLGGISQIASEHHGLCQGTGDYRTPIMKTDSRRLFKEGVDLAVKTWTKFLDVLQCNTDDFDHVLTHQVSAAHHRRIFQEFGLQENRGRTECVNLGNTGSIAAPLSLALASDEGVLKTGQRIALLGIGSGLNTMMLGIQW